MLGPKKIVTDASSEVRNYGVCFSPVCSLFSQPFICDSPSPRDRLSIGAYDYPQSSFEYVGEVLIVCRS